MQVLYGLTLVGFVPGTRLTGPAIFGLRVKAPYVVLSDLWVSPSCRRQGNGQRVMQMVVQAADQCGCPVRLRAAPFDVRRGGMSLGDLQRWYGRWGFEAAKGGHMVRQARSER